MCKAVVDVAWKVQVCLETCPMERPLLWASPTMLSQSGSSRPLRHYRGLRSTMPAAYPKPEPEEAGYWAPRWSAGLQGPNSRITFRPCSRSATSSRPICSRTSPGQRVQIGHTRLQWIAHRSDTRGAALGSPSSITLSRIAAAGRPAQSIGARHENPRSRLVAFAAKCRVGQRQ